MSTPVPALTCSSTMWPSEAGPDVAQRTAPGRALASVSSPLKSLACRAEVPSSSTGDAMTLTTGTMSLAGSNGDAPRCGFSASGLMAAKPRVCPSVALATASRPMLPLAPALLSTSTLCPSKGVSRSAKSRATLSATPPGG